MLPLSDGMVTAARVEAAEAGVAMLNRGGTAADAAAATALALAVTDPANCGIGGYGGFAVVDVPGAPTAQVAFNTAAPHALDIDVLRDAPRRGPFVRSGPSVSPPAVVAGLWLLHRTYGRLPWAEIVTPAIALARDGFVVGDDLGRALNWAFRDRAKVEPSFAQVFGPGDRRPEAGDRLRQPDLAATLEAVQRDGPAALISGRIAESVVATAAKAGGSLRQRDLADLEASVLPAVEVAVGPAMVHGTEPTTSGFGVLSDALAAAGSAAWNAHDHPATLRRIESALRQAWRAREQTGTSLLGRSHPVQHTSHLCAADRSGALVSLTFTHGPLWFGSGLVADGTGIVLNCGANLFVRDPRSGNVFAQANITPVVARTADGSRYAFGTPGGRRIPAVVMTVLVDIIERGAPLEVAINQPRVSVAANGTLEVEPPLDSVLPGTRLIAPDEFYGPASGIQLSPAGVAAGAKDGRFDGAVVAGRPPA